MKTIAFYLSLVVGLFGVINIFGAWLSEYFAFSKAVYLIITFIAFLCIYLVIKIYREKECFVFNRLVSILIVIVFSSLSVSSLLDKTYNLESILDYKLLSINKELPRMVDPGTLLEKVYIKDGNIFFEYTMLNLQKDKLNLDLITLVLTDRIYRLNYGIDRMILSLSKKQRVINYIFKDKDKNFLTKVQIKLN